MVLVAAPRKLVLQLRRMLLALHHNYYSVLSIDFPPSSPISVLLTENIWYNWMIVYGSDLCMNGGTPSQRFMQIIVDNVY